MQKKIYTGILLVAVILIWGYVGYTLVNGMSDSEEEITEDQVNEPLVNVVKIKHNEKLKLNYTDPFLKNDYVKKPYVKPEKLAEKPSNKPQTLKPITTAFSWPNIAYRGIIKNQSKPDKILGLLLVDGKEYLVKKGDKIANIAVLTIDKSSIQLSAENNKQVFLLTQ